MSVPDPGRAATQLETATAALRDALLGDDEAAVGPALADREACLTQLAAGLKAVGAPDAGLLARIEQVKRADAEVLALARERLAAVQTPPAKRWRSSLMS